MKVNYYPDSKGAKGRGIVAFLEAHKVRHQLVEPTPALRRRICGGVDLPAIEVDGRFFVNPNRDALRKILRKG
ncbi:MAG: hypothetical protein KY459_12245 [Acidobacteria bacterium]|nr:hypothetical protein [Acidobacteriota bacterium]